MRCSPARASRPGGGEPQRSRSRHHRAKTKTTRLLIDVFRGADRRDATRSTIARGPRSIGRRPPRRIAHHLRRTRHRGSDGQDLVSFECSASRPDRFSLVSSRAERAGDRAGAEGLERLRQLGGTPQLLSRSRRHALGRRSPTRSAHRMMNPGDRSLSSVYAAEQQVRLSELMALAPPRVTLPPRSLARFATPATIRCSSSRASRRRWSTIRASARMAATRRRPSSRIASASHVRAAASCTTSCSTSGA